MSSSDTRTTVNAVQSRQSQQSQQSQRVQRSRQSTRTRSVVVPVYAERPRHVRSLVGKLYESGWDEVVVCADAPDDALASTLSTLDDDEETVVSLSDTRRGKGGALADGLDATTGDVVGYVDADGAIPVAELDRIYGVVEDNYAPVAVGSRDLEGDCRASQSRLRQCLARGYRWLARRASGVPVHDLQCGAKAFRREVWVDVAADVAETGFAFDTELMARAYDAGYAVREVAISWDDPGDSSVDPRQDAPEMLKSLVRIRRALDEPAASGGDVSAVGDAADPLKVALVTSHPPNRGHLAEYGEQLAMAYAGRDDIDVTVLSRRSESGPPVEYRHGYEVKRVWDRDSFDGAKALLRELTEGDYDAVQFNIHMTYFGNENVYRFIGLALPSLLSKVYRIPVVTTMHDLLEVVEDEMVDENVGVFERAGARAATQIALMGDASTVTSQEYLDVVTDRYYSKNVHHVPHGTFACADGGLPSIPSPLRIMVFGHLSPTKDVATVVEAFEQIRVSIPDAELVVAGDSHPGFPNHREELEAEYGDVPGVRFHGYVEDEEMDEMWNATSLVVMPYRTCTGVSGVFQLAKTYGTPVVSFDNDGMRTSTVETGGDAAFVPPQDPTALADEILDLWVDRDRLREIARANADAAAAYTIADTADRMVELMRSEVEA